MGFFSKGGHIKEPKLTRFDFPEYRIVEVTNAYGTKHWEIEKRVGDQFAWECIYGEIWGVGFDTLGAARRTKKRYERRDRESVGVGRRVVG